MHLSDTQRAVFDYLREHIQMHGYPPSQMEIAARFGFRQNRSARYHLQALADAGLIELVPGQARGIRLNGRDSPAAVDPAAVDPAVVDPVINEALPPSARNDEILQVPLYGRVAAGLPIGSDPEVRRHIALDPSVFRLRPDYLLEVEGESMLLDGILPGDLIGVHRTPEARSGQIVVARIEGELTVKRLDLHADGTGAHLRLLPRNPAYAPIRIDATIVDFAIEGLFAGLLRPG
ncbi:MAG: transcriptional repressor LexA [Pseudomonadota bacterium]|nr:transcriptional repressor LexA [Pseudomonadota bacterium]